MENTVHIDDITEEQRRLLINNYFKAGKIELPSFTKGRIILVYAGVFLGIVLMFYLKKIYLIYMMKTVFIVRR